MTLDELNLIKNYITNDGTFRQCGIPECNICAKEQKILVIVDREIALKTFDPNKNG